MMLSSPAAMAHASSFWLALPGRMSTERMGEIARRWMEMVLSEQFTQGFPQALLSGEVLCALADKLYRALGMRERSCASIKTSWPSAMNADDLAITDELNGVTMLDDDQRRSSERLRIRESNINDQWLRQKRVARDNIEEYLRACEVIGVLPQDMFQPDDLLDMQNLDKVYRNILALQSVAVSISQRRSIDARSSASISMKVVVSDSPAPSLMTPHDSFLSSRRSTDLLTNENMSWDELLEKYETLQQVSEEVEASKGQNSTKKEGVGKLAHDLWRTEEHVRARLLREDGLAERVPEHLHGKLWMLSSGAGTERRRRKIDYQRFLAMAVDETDATRQIDADLHRTVPEEDKALWNEDKSKMMRRVLVAYSCFNPTLGYCQGLNYIVARLLQFVEEEDAFYLLIKMIQIVPEDFYTTMLGLAVDQHVFADLVRVQEQPIAAHLEMLGGSGMELSLACTEWFLTLFSSPCPRDVTVRIWDLLFFLGDEVLFRFALALMKMEREQLLKCNAYGDMLKRLNEIGRQKTDVDKLAVEALRKETVSRALIDDFRAHHRLQLATGIAVHSAENATSDVSDVKEDAKAKLFGAKKRPGLFKPADINAGRAHDTFDRPLTEAYTASLQKEHPTFSCYYDGRPPLVFDQYWGSSASQSRWGKRNYRRITEVGVKDVKEERRRLQSDGSNLFTAQKVPDDASSGPRTSGSDQGRERRSKSIAFIQQNKKTPTRRIVDEDAQLSRSPKGWLQRIEGWHKDLKLQKEKKKAEKLKMKFGQMENESSSVPSRGFVGRDRGQNVTLAAPSWRHIEENELPRGVSFDGHRMAKPRVEKRTESMDVNVSRSYSDPYLSPNDAVSRNSWQDPGRKSMGDDVDAQIIMRSQEPDKPEFAKSKILERQRSGSMRRESLGDMFPPSRFTGAYKATASDGNARARRPRPSSTEMKSDVEKTAPDAVPASMPSLNAFDLDVTDSSRISFDMGKPPAPVITDLTLSASKRASLKLNRAISEDLADERLREDIFESLGQPSMRRNQSLPVEDAGATLHLQQQQQHNQQQFYNRHMKKVTSDTARVIRERAQVLSYMQRKASDASSLAGSFPLTPNEPTDVLRLSGSSSDSSRYSEFMLPTTRSAKSVVQPPVNVRKSSFSFFDKLSSDTESHLDDLHGSMKDENESRESFDSAIFSRTWSPSSAHHKILAAMSGTD